MFSPGTALLGIAVMLAAPCLETGHSATPLGRAMELSPHCSKAAVQNKLADNTPSGLPHLEFIIVDSPAQTPDAATPQAAAPPVPTAQPADTPSAGPSVNGSQDCPAPAHPEKPRVG
jgi:hypothetical protein